MEATECRVCAATTADDRRQPVGGERRDVQSSSEPYVPPSFSQQGSPGSKTLVTLRVSLWNLVTFSPFSSTIFTSPQ